MMKTDPSTPADAIAVVGMSCRLPKAKDPAAFWRLLRDEVSAITEMPAERGPRAENALRWGGFLDRVDAFDAGFFGIGAGEAAAMDPQQRLILELAWEALEDARIAPERVRGGAAGVFVGAMWDDYAVLQRSQGPDMVSQHTVTGGSRGIIANRASYFLGMRGPSMTVDCGQSSSLVAVHLAAESLRRGESDLALAGGVSLGLAEDSAIRMERFGGISPDGRCYTFDARANGFVRGEGGALVVLKPLARAIEDSDHVYCVIAGSAMNNDGHGEGLTRPAVEGQREVLRAAYQRAGAAPSAVQYVELHGTGTRVGDPVEAEALGAVLGGHPDRDQPLLVGSVKTNVGHLEGAAGIAGLLKVALAIRHGEIPASLNFRTPSAAIQWDTWRLRVPRRTRPWPAGRRLAGVSSFGMGGTNCHVVLTGPPPAADPPAVPVTGLSAPPAAVPWVVSAADDAGLRAQAARLAEFSGSATASVADIGFSLAATRSALRSRAVVVAPDLDGHVRGLQALAAGDAQPRVAEGRSDADGGLVFMFPGQGAQWAGMGAGLLDASPDFLTAMREIDSVIAPLANWSVIDVLRGAAGAPSLDGVHVVQPALFAIMVCLARLWESWGIRPDAVVGHSQGEIAAAHVAGGLSLEDAARIVVLRSRLIATELAGRGGMLAVALPRREAERRLAPWGSRVSVAVVNAADAVVLAGARDATDEIAAQWASEGVRVHRLPVDYASHSPQVEQLRDQLLDSLAAVRPRPGRIPLYSSVTGQVQDLTAMDAGYWYRNLRSPVDFEAATRALIADGFGFFAEMSPHPVLVPALPASAGGRQVASAGSLRRDDGGLDRLLLSVADLWVRGLAVDWGQVVGGGRRVALPGYAFQRRRHWLDTAHEPGEAERAAPGAPRARQAASLGAPDAGGRRQALLDLIRTEAAAVTGNGSLRSMRESSTFSEAGLDSVTAIELRNRLNTVTGAALPGAALFDYPTPGTLAGYLASRLAQEQAQVPEVQPAAGVAEGAGTVTAAGSEPIAIVGMACRLPGGVCSPEQFWDLVRDERDAIGAFPTDRGWDLDGLYDPDPGKAGKTYTRHGGFLYDAPEFDASLFRISPREAAAMDPQQRLLLETSWEAFERAGIDVGTLRGSDTGVFVGAMASDYGPRLHEAAGQAAGYLLTGTTGSVASGRVSYVFGFTGPAITVDTGCSASLVSLHLATAALRRGECSLALAGGATVMSSPGIFVEFSRQRGLSPDGRCKAFAATADGTGWAEGAGVLLLERLSDARRNGHPVLALVRGTAVNSDGASNGLTAPNGPAQEAVIRRALADAGLNPADVDAVEAHGTGTALGDPIEAQALVGSYGAHRPPQHPLWVGSAKSNIGHTQAAAGVAGVIKMVAAIRHGVLPRTLHVEEPSPYIDWSAGSVRLLTEARLWPAAGRPRRAGVSSFGIGGTNAHVIIEQAPRERTAPAVRAALPTVPCVVSGASVAGLRGQAARLAEFAGSGADHIADIGSSLASSRAALDHRSVVLAADRAGLAEGLRAVAAGQPAASVVEGTADADGGVVFIFPGQGAQWAGMGARLLQVSSAFAARMAECERALAEYVDWSLTATVRDGGSLDRADIVQPVSWAVMVSLAAQWESWGIRPDAVVGHSQGEVAAAVVAGALSLGDGARVIAARSRVIAARLAGRGAMAAIGAAEPVVARLLEPGTVIAAVNGPESVVISGSGTEQTLSRAAAIGLRVRRIPVNYASHSPAVDTARDELMTALADIAPAPPRLPFLSSVTAQPEEHLDAAYWFRNLRAPVRFHAAAQALVERGHRFFIEASPHPVLAPAMEVPSAIAVGSLRRDDGGLERMVESLARLWVRGLPVDWTRVIGGGRQVDLPTYAFQRQRYWIEGPAARTDQSAWRYRVTWQRVSPDATARLSGRWLLAVSAGGQQAAEAAERALRQAGARPARLDVSPADDRAALSAQLRALADGDKIAGVVSLLALTAGEEPARGCTATSALFQALGDARVTAPLWLLTRGAVATAEAEPLEFPEQALTWGLGYSLALAQPARWGGLIDLPPRLDDAALALLGSALAGAGDEDQLAIRPGQLLARRLVRAVPGAAAPTWRTRGTALVTGGTGGLGRHLARWLAGKGAEHIVLVSRGGGDAPGTAGLTAELAGLGVPVTVARCDVGDRDALAAVLAAIPADRPLRTVVHAAGTMLPGSPRELTQDDIMRAVRPKAIGAAHLDELTRDRELDAFVLFSSGAGVWGSGDQGAYGAANAFLDALAKQRRGRGLPATALAWGAWAGAGMGEREGLSAQWQRLGIRAMAPARALAELEQALGRGETALTVADIEWEKFLPVFTGARRRPLLSALGAPPAVPELAAVPEMPVREPAGPVPAGLARELASRPGTEVQQRLLELVRAQSRAVLGHIDSAEFYDDRSLIELGLDSLTTLELRDRLVAALGLPLPAALLFEHPTPGELAKALAVELSRGPELETADPVSALLRRAFAAGKYDDGMALLTHAARLRPMFADEPDPASRPQLVRLTRGGRKPLIVCFSAVIATAGAQVYSRFAARFRDAHEVSAVTVPGFQPGESLPEDLDVVVRAQAELVAGHAGTAPTVLVGTSSGGWLAHAVAARLEATGRGPAGVALLDSYPPGGEFLARHQDRVISQALERQAEFGSLHGDRLSAMGWYLRLFSNWRPAAITAPTLLVRASRPLVDRDAELDDARWLSDWPLPHTAVDVPGDHFTILEEHAVATAAAVRDWLPAR